MKEMTGDTIKLFWLVPALVICALLGQGVRTVQDSSEWGAKVVRAAPVIREPSTALCDPRYGEEQCDLIEVLEGYKYEPDKFADNTDGLGVVSAVLVNGRLSHSRAPSRPWYERGDAYRPEGDYHTVRDVRDRVGCPTDQDGQDHLDIIPRWEAAPDRDARNSLLASLPPGYA